MRIFIFNKTKIFGQKRLLANQKRLKNLHEGFDGIREIKIFGLSNYFLSKFLNANTDSNTFEFKNTFNLLLPRYLLEWLLILLSLLLLFLFFYFNDFINFERSISLLALFCVAMFRLIPSLLRIIQSMQQIKFTDVVVKNVYYELKEQIKINCNEVKINSQKKILFNKYLSLENLNFGYGNKKKEIISNLNIKVSFGKFLGISGDSGSGKTTLLSIILGLLKPVKGDILADDISIFDNVSDWQTQIAYVPQNLYLIDDTIQNNIVLGSLEENINFGLLKKSIDIACLKELINELPEGLKTNIGEKGINLSGGQRQRIGIARAIYRQPKLLLLDEFTNALDKKIEQEILNNIYDLKNTVTGIIVSHDYSVIKKCDMFINLNK